METVTVFWASVWNACCESRSMITARTREELWTKITDGQNRGVLSSVYETGTREDLDPDQLLAEMAEAERRSRTSCPMPPESDLLLLRDAKRVDPHDFDAIQAIDAGKGSARSTRQRLREIRSAKYNEYLRLRREERQTP